MRTITKTMFKPRFGLLSLFLGLMLAGITSCTVSLVPSYDKEITGEVNKLMKEIHSELAALNTEANELMNQIQGSNSLILKSKES
jgi:hypothetical protein